MRFKRTKSNCEECPLRDRKRVWGVGPEDPSIIFIGEAPGRDEDRLGEPFVGAAGGTFNYGLARAGILRHRTWVTNLICCRPPNNDFKSADAIAALEYCTAGLNEELDFCVKSGGKVFCKLGGAALDLFNIRENITAARGSVYLFKDLPFVPTFHPAYLMRLSSDRGEKGKPQYKYVWWADLEKIKTISTSGWKPPAENFNIGPTLIELETYIAARINNHDLIAVDIETTSLNPTFGVIVVIGLAHNATDAISVPLLAEHGHEYWRESEKPHVISLLNELFSACPLMFQNSMFDVRYLREHGFHLPPKNIAYDTMLLHHAVSPELPHDLGFIVSLYGDTPYWKSDYLKSDDTILNMNPQVMRTYNLRDCVVLHQILPGLLTDLKETGTESVFFSESMPLIEPIMTMMNNGIKLERSKLDAYTRKLQKERHSLDEELHQIAGLPSHFNLDSPDHLRYFLFGTLPSSFKDVEEKLTAKKKTNTKVYAKLAAIKELKDKTKPLVSMPTSYRGRKTDGGKQTTNEQGFLGIQRSLSNRLAYLGNLSRAANEHESEASGIRKLLQWIELYRRFANIDHLISTYSDFPTDAASRVHTSFLIHGTATGRLASRKPNLQNIPKENADTRKAFVPEEGFIFLSADYENLEVRILAYETNEPALIAAFEKDGLNIHDENTKILFQIDKTHPLWKVARMAAKKFIFGTSYGGSDNEVYEKVILECPTLGLTFAQFKQAKQRFLDAYPGYKVWSEKVKQQALTERKSINHFGRVRVLMGDERDILKEALNTPIQSTAASIVNRALTRIYMEILSRNLNSKPLLQIHDELLFEVLTNEITLMRKLVKTEMERPIDYHGRPVVFPVEIKTGHNWGEMK